MGGRYERRKLRRPANLNCVANSVAAKSKKTKGSLGANLLTLVFTGRDGGIRTHDPLHPMQVRYLAALRPEWTEL